MNRVEDEDEGRCRHCPRSASVSGDEEDAVCEVCRRLRHCHYARAGRVVLEQNVQVVDVFPGPPRARAPGPMFGNSWPKCRAGAGRWLRCASSVVRWGHVAFGRTFPRNAPLAWVLLTLMLVLPAFGDAQALGSAIDRRNNSSKVHVCQSIDIRNSVKEFSRLEGCQVVEGFVQILLIDYADDSAYANLTFPDLVEITEYLVLYRVNGLRNLSHLFPNLSLIRGSSLFINYALVAFEMMHLQEIGLTSLTAIMRGSVRFEKNPALCYVDTIDWNLIARAAKDEHVIAMNKQKNGCPVCDKICPARATKPDETLCWNRQHCQKVCPEECGERACSASGECCHPLCLGGCTGPSNRDCLVCKGVIVNGSECVQRCLNGTFEFMNRRCITKTECWNMRRPKESSSMVKLNPYKTFNGSCIIECPAGYMEDEVDGKGSCKKCDGQCLKECSPANVDSIASAQKLRGCTHIVGSLEIQIRGGRNIVKELEENLNMIEIIDGYLKIVRSFPLVSLNFLRNLKEIRGKSLENSKYTLTVLDNQNLQELWDWETHKSLKILSKNEQPGKVFFHFNPKLCYQKIEALRLKAGLHEFTELEVATNSNGDKVACNVTELKVLVAKKTSEAALIHWEAYKHHDPRSLLGYVVYFTEAPRQNVTLYDGRDACGGDGWKVDDVSVVEPPTDSFQSGGRDYTYAHILTQLKPFTQYAFYVKTYTIATEKSGAQSKLMYFTTNPGAPSPPRGVNTYSNSSDVLIISWTPPHHNNGKLVHYRIVGRWESDDSKFLAQRNYCEEPMYLPEKKSLIETQEEERRRMESEQVVPRTPSCDCSDREPDQSAREKEVTSSIAFEDALHNRVYVRRDSATARSKRHVSILNSIPKKRDSYSYPKEKDFARDEMLKASKASNNSSEVAMLDEMKGNSIVAFTRLVPSSNLTFSMKKLLHFAAYNIEIQACRERVEGDKPGDDCSTKSMRTSRTLPKEGADDIPHESFQVTQTGNNSLNMVKLQWQEPPEPNGVIVTYQIEFKRIDIQNVQPTIMCTTRYDFVNNSSSYILKDLSAGNYSVKVRATSLAGNGAYTPVKYFYIKEYNSHSALWSSFAVMFILVALVSLAGYYVYKRKYKRSVPNMRLIATVNPEYVSTVYVPDEWEVPRKKVQVLRELGNGSFGMVYEGIAKNIVKGKPEVRCAVKTVNEQATDRERIEFLNEASVMKAFDTHHVVRLLGVVSKGQPTLVVMELMTHGDLKCYLRSHRPDVCENFSKQPPTLKRILQMALEIADGMCYLAAKKFVHRDLAARNCMVAEDLTVKIGDFGMTRDIYETDYYRKGSKGLLPVRWMAPESLKDGVFTSSSDVWSYGIVLWEMVTLASQPYQGLSNDQVLHYVIDGGVMERPENCPDLLYSLMRQTWNHKSTKRPTFIDITTVLLQEVQVENFEKVSFYHSSEGIEARNQNSAHAIKMDIDVDKGLQDVREEELEMEENSPLHPSGNFTSIVPMRYRNNLNSRYNDNDDALRDSDKTFKSSINFQDLNSSKTPLKAGFDDFDGVSGGSLASSKDTLNLPYVEESAKNSPGSAHVRAISPPNSVSPQSLNKQSFQESTSASKTSLRTEPDYENRSPEILSRSSEKSSLKSTPVRMDFPTIEESEKNKRPESLGKSETLNNGYISGAAK